jgi:predicted alpha-1,2-mannosidase
MKTITTLLAVFLIINQSFAQNKFEPVNYVDPLIGTGFATTPSALKHGEGTESKAQNIPSVGVPFGNTNWVAQTQATETKCVAPYYYADKKIQGFRGSHWLSGSCTQDYGSFTLMPVSGMVKTSPKDWASGFEHAQEVAKPYYYSAFLNDYAIKAEMTALSYSAIFRFAWQNTDTAVIIIQPNSDENVGFIEIDTLKNEVRGTNPVHRIYQGWGQPAGFYGNFVVQFDAKIVDFGTFADGNVFPDKIQVYNQKGIGIYVKFILPKDKTLKIKAANSFVNFAGAKNNLQTEIPDWNFDAVKEKSRENWNRELAKIEVESTNKDELTKFYSAMYHAMLLPRTFSDADGLYPSFSGQLPVQKVENGAYYCDFSMWDTYRALHPLFTIFQPTRAKDMVNSLIAKAEQGGWLPIFPCWNSYTAAMVGDHVISCISDTYLKGISGINIEKGYPYMIQNAMKSPANFEDYKNGMGRRALTSYLKYGFIPDEDPVNEAFHKKEQVSRTLEYAYDDFALAQVARQLGKKEDYQKLLKRAANYKNVFDPKVGLMRGRHENGQWVADFTADKKMYYITEGTPWQYSWYVPQDVQGLIKLMGGREKFVQKLDTLFGKGLYWHGNEPGHQIPYLYNFAGAPWKSQEVINQIRKDEYSTGPGGLSGNEDGGQMSAWYIFASMGFYPACPGVPEYVIGTPAFSQLKIHLENGKTFTLKAKNVSEKNIYIQSANLNGKPFNQAFIKHANIVNGAELILQMGDKPNKQWASSKSAAPFSMTR